MAYNFVMTDEKDIFIEKTLDAIHALRETDTSGVHIAKLEHFAGSYRDFPERVSPRIKSLYRDKGISRLYSHQAEAIEAALAGRHVVAATPTASGKTLIYNILTLDAVTRDPYARALYLFPTKALSQDQLAELFELNAKLDNSLGLFTYDGDTPQSTRKAIRQKAQIVLTNPYMLHSGILPHHTKWANLFENLKYIIIDELHYYTGVFGSHTANIMRRLKRICRFYGSDPIFIMSSATIANPGELAEKIIEAPVEVVDRSGAPRGEKYLVFLNPPIINRELGIRRSYVTVARQMAGLLIRNKLQVITFANSRLITEVLVKYLKNDFEKNVTDTGKIRGYRGGYLPQKRREIEQGLRNGEIQAVVSTNALELGIDIGSLDAVVLASYPGTIASTWQRIGRAGRRSGKSIGILVSSSSPVDQFIVNHPEYFTGKSPEMGRINPDNLSILIEHIKCAAFELPFVSGESFGGENLMEILEYLSKNNILFQNQDKWFWTEQGYPADAVSINRASSDNFVVVDRTDTEKVIAEVDFGSALETLHPKAIYMLESEQYVVEEFDYHNRKAYVKKSESDYYTDAVTHTKISLLDIFDRVSGERYDYAHGDVHVFSQVVGFKKLKFFTNENVGAGDLQLPQREMHSTAFWLSVKSDVLIMIDLPSEEKMEAITGIAYLMRHICAVMLMCDVRDLGVAVEDNITKASINRHSLKNSVVPEWREQAQYFEPNIYIYDSYPNGIGFSEVLYNHSEEILEKVLEAIKECPCERGCPSCVGPAVRSGDRHKEAAGFIVSILLDRVYH